MDDAYSNKPTSPNGNRRQTIESLRSENMNYIDSSDVIVEYYKNLTVSGLDKYFLEIEDWLEQDKNLHDNTPLVLEADDGIGKKTLLVKWMEYHQQNKKGRYPDFIIPHFATQSGKNSNYFYAIYRILIKLRETLNIKQKVELLEEKLRKYFHYWLEICSRELENQLFNDTKVMYDKVILIFEGIDNFRDMSDLSREANVSFWLPKYFPKNIKVIVTAERKSNSMRILKPTSHIIPIVSDENIIRDIKKVHMSKHIMATEQKKAEFLNIYDQLSPQITKQPLFVRSYFSVFLPYATEGVVDTKDVDIAEIDALLNGYKVEDFQALKSVEDLFEFILLTFKRKKIFKTEDDFVKVISILAITQKGLTYQEIQSVCGFERREWKIFLTFFKTYIMKHRDLWIIHNEMFKKVLIRIFGLYRDDSTRKLHDDIASAINKQTNNSIRKLEEETYNLFMARNYFRLKEIISIIENFLLLFNPNNKYDLCRYWQTLEEHGFDPVLEYNKTIEGFQIHYLPTPEDLFRIIIQVSRFLKEFGDFETINTPKFRHPPIIGTLDELHKIGLLVEILKLDLYYNKDPELKNFQPQVHIGKVTKPIKAEVLTKVESLNVEIQKNREDVRNIYLEHIQKKEEHTETEEQDIIFTLDPDKFQKDIKGKLEKVEQQKIEQLSKEDELSGENVSTDYYYKRWIWIQFPWACLSISKQCDYSIIIKHCFSSATDYMSVEEEHAYTNSALKIAIEAKLKKKQLYESNFDENSILDIIPQRSVLELQQPSMETQQSYESAQFDRSKLPKLTQHSITSINSEAPKRSLYITQDYLDFDVLNQEQKKSHLTSSIPNLDGVNTRQLIQKSQQFKGRLRSYQSNQIALNSYQQTEIFPVLKNEITKHTSKQIQALESQAKIMRKQLDKLIYDNMKVAKELKQQKILAYNKGYIKKEIDNAEKYKDLAKEAQQKVIKAKEQLKISTKQETRVRTITKICRDNKQQNEEWIRYLNYLINNFKKLIKFEQQDAQKLNLANSNLENTIIDFLRTYTQRAKNQRELLAQIKRSLQEKSQLDQLFNNADTLIQEKALGSVQELRKKQANFNTQQEFKKKKQQHEKNQKLIQEELEKYNKLYEQIKDTFDIKVDYQATNKFIDFKANITKKTELDIIYEQQNQKLSEVKAKKERLDYQIQTYEKANQSDQRENQSSQKDQSEDGITNYILENTLKNKYEQEIHDQEEQKQQQLQQERVKKNQEKYVKLKLGYEGALVRFQAIDQQQHNEKHQSMMNIHFLEQLKKQKETQNAEQNKKEELHNLLAIIKQKKELIISKNNNAFYKQILDQTIDMKTIERQLAPKFIPPKPEEQ